MIRFKIDENLPQVFIEILHSGGHDAATVLDEGLGGAPDDRILEQCKIERRVLITLDLDFSDLRRYPPEDMSGLIVFRARQQDKRLLQLLLRNILPLLEREPLDKHLWIVEETRIRIRGD